MGLIEVVRDSFTEAGTVNLSAHTADTGGGWNPWNGASRIAAGAGYAESNNPSSGNRSNHTTPLTSAYCLVRGQITNAEANTTLPVGPGIFAMCTTSGNATGYEFYHTGGATEEWEMQCNVSPFTLTSLTEARPSYPADFRLYCTKERKSGCLGTVEKVVDTTDLQPTGKYVGIILLNFSGSVPNAARCDDFTAAILYPDPRSVQQALKRAANF